MTAVRHGRQRVRMRLPPESAAQEPPLEELAARDGEPVQPAATQDDRDDARALRRDAYDRDRVRQRPPRRKADPRADDDPQRAEPQHGPPQARDGMPDERGARVDLVREGQEERE